MRTIRTLLQLLLGRLTGMNELEVKGRKYWLAPAIAGADEGEGEGEEKPKEGEEEKPKEGEGDGGEEKPKEGEEELGETGKKALDAERTARREAERKAKAAEKKLEEKEDAELGEKERAEKRAEKAEEASKAATAKLRKANLITALAEDHELTGAKGKAAARLLDGTVEYDEDSDEPTNLKEAIEAATAEFGEDAFKAATAAGGKKENEADQGARSGGGDDKPKGLKGAIARHVGESEDS